MANISLPFGLARNNGEAVTNATEIDIQVGDDTMSLSAALSETFIDQDTWDDMSDDEKQEKLEEYENVYITE